MSALTLRGCSRQENVEMPAVPPAEVAIAIQIGCAYVRVLHTHADAEHGHYEIQRATPAG